MEVVVHLVEFENVQEEHAVAEADSCHMIAAGKDNFHIHCVAALEFEYDVAFVESLAAEVIENLIAVVTTMDVVAAAVAAAKFPFVVAVVVVRNQDTTMTKNCCCAVRVKRLMVTVVPELLVHSNL